jgi:light-regulated signal transduction histidine kinase (bacteriophytochrome)
LQAIPDGFMIFESVRNQQNEIIDFRWLYVNPEAERVVGRSSEDLVGKRLIEEMPRNKELGLFDRYKEVVANGQSIKYELAYKDYYFINRAVKINDGIAVVFSDITARKDFEKELEKAVQQRTAALEEANELLRLKNKELEQFAFVTSHDLQEPLRKIQIFAGMLRDGSSNGLDDKSKIHLDKIIYSAERMRNLITDLLQFPKITHAQEQHERIDLNEELASVLQTFELKIAEQQAQIDYSLLPAVRGIAWQINLLISNIVANSLKFVRPDVSPHIEIKGRTLSAEEVKSRNLNEQEQYVLLVFSDNGIGFDQEFADLVFQMFKRLQDRQTYDGTGLGLALCARIAEYHQGMIQAFSTPGLGTRIEVVLIKA